MRIIARGSTPEACQQRVEQLKKAGWKPITEVKLDPSPTIDISFVCVMEREDDSTKKRRFNSYVSFR